MTTPPLDLPALKKIANAATDGPWTAERYSFGVQDGRIRVTSPTDSGIYNLAEDVTVANAAHIAAFDPPTVLALLDSVDLWEDRAGEAAGKYIDALARAEAAEKAVAAVRELHPRVVIAVHESHGEEAICPQCQHHWPCATIAALDGAV